MFDSLNTALTPVTTLFMGKSTVFLDRSGVEDVLNFPININSIPVVVAATIVVVLLLALKNTPVEEQFISPENQYANILQD